MSKTINILNNKNLLISFNSNFKELKDNKFIYRSNAETRYLNELDRSKLYDLSILASINSQFFTQIDSSTFDFKIGYSYAKEEDFTYVIDGVNFKISDGVPFKSRQEGQYLILDCFTKHNVNSGDFIYFSGNAYEVIDLGVNLLYRDRTIRILADPFIDRSSYGAFKKIQDPSNITTVSQYYIERIKFFDVNLISNLLSLSQNNISVSRELNTGPNSVVNFKNLLITGLNLSLNDLVDENNIPISQIILSCILNGYSNENIWDFNRYNQTNITNAQYNRPRILFNSFDDLSETYGDFVEFNPINFTKNVLSQSFNKVLNINPSETFFGYYNIKKIDIFSFDLLVNTSLYKEDAPNYAIYNDTIGLWFWRDIIPYSSNSENIIKFSFINGKHIINKNWNIYLENEINNFIVDNFFNQII